MSSIYPNRFSQWVPDPNQTEYPPENGPPSDNITMDTNVNSSSHSDNNNTASNTWDIGRLMALNRNRNWREAWNPRMSMSFTNTKGLLNAPGENNCFLNSAVQVLWHLDVFRRSFRMLSGHSCLGNNSCIFCALKVIFTQFQYSDQSALPPDALRKALAKTFADQRRFQLGLMDDAAECFENILTQIHFHIANGESEDMCNAKHCISHQMFAMTVVEQVVCQCEATSEPFPFNQMVNYVSTSALVNQYKAGYAHNGAAPFGNLLKRALSDGDFRNCPSNCGKKVQLRRTLMNYPDVVSVGLVWDSDNPSTEHIHDVVRSIGTSIRLQELFHSVVDPRCRQSAPLTLSGIVCYYGKHYSTFFFHSKMRTWVSFDDANVKEVGSSWSAVVDKCCRGHYQPLLLLYTNPDAEPICTDTAPQKTVIIKENKFLNNNDDSGFNPPGAYHVRQRSCDSLSGTIGGQSIDESYILPASSTHYTKGRRSMTPDPDTTSSMNSLPRRSRTPGPEWGTGYNSDDEKSAKTVRHSRQNSYLSALDCVDGPKKPSDPYQYASAPPKPENPRAPSGEYREPGAAYQKGVGNVGAYSVRYARLDANSSKDDVDLLGSLPHQGQQQQYASSQKQQYATQQPQYGHPNQQYGQPHQQQPQQYGSHGNQQQQQQQQQQYYGGYSQANTSSYPGSGYSQASTSSYPGSSYSQANTSSYPGNGYSQANANSYPGSGYSQANTNSYPGSSYHSSSAGYPAVSTQQPIVSVAKSSTNYQVTNAHSGSHQYSAHQQPKQQPQHYNTLPYNHGYDHQSAPATALKRTHSLESNQDGNVPNIQQQPSRPSVSRNRPSSARPYDYPNGRPTVDISKATTGAVTQEWGEGVLVGDFTTPDSCEPSTKTPSSAASSKGSWSPPSDEDGAYDSYINRKTVQNVMNIQKRTNPSGPPGIKSAPIHTATSNPLEEQKQQKAWLHNQALMRDLKVDIPGDNISLGSHKDSGYRSGGSSGDRNSASSNSSVTFDSPTADTFRGLHRSLGNTFNCSSHSSSESLSSNQSAQTVKTIQGNHRLSLIPENNCSSSASSSTVNKSQESLVGSQETLDGFENQRPKSDSRHLDQKQQQQSSRLNPQFNSGHDAECERLFLQAESLMESSTKQEDKSDTHSALAYCNQAITCLQKALTIHGASNDTIVRVRMKHNSCVLRSRRLHKTILDRQTSNQSSLSAESGDVGSWNSDDSSNRYQSTESYSQDRRRSDRPLISMEEQPKRDHELMQEKVKELYSRQFSGHHSRPNTNYPQQTVKAVSGMAQSRPVHGITVGTCSVPKSATTESGLFEHSSRSRNNSTSNDLDCTDSMDASDTRQAELYGTLPKRKGKGAKPIAASVPVVPKENVQVYQSYLDRQKSVAAETQQSVEDKLDYSRQVSKDEIRNMLAKDFVGTRTETKSPGPQRRRRNSYDPLDATQQVPQNRYEEMLADKMAAPTMSIHDLPPKQKYMQPPPPVKPSGNPESHYDYLPGRNKNHSSILPPHVKFPSSPSKPKHRYSEPIAHKPGQSLLSETRNYSEESDSNRNVKPSAVKKLDKTQQQQPFMKVYEIQRPGEQGKPAVVETVPIKVKPDLPPKVSSKLAKPQNLPNPRNPANLKSRNDKHHSYPPLKIIGQGDLSTNSTTPSVDNSGTFTSSLPPGGRPLPGGDFDLPPPPAELLYPTDPPPPPGSQCTCGATSHDDGELMPPPPTTTPTKPKPAIKKPAAATKPLRKNVHFDDNIILISTPEDTNAPEIDYVAYVMNLGKKKETDTKSENDDDTGDSMDGDEILKSDCVKCTLCRKKRIEPTEIYCKGCTFYMSQFQPQES